MEPVHLPIKTKDVNKHVKTKEAAIIDSKNNLMSLESLRSIICAASSKASSCIRDEPAQWQSASAELLHFLCINEEPSSEPILLAAHAYLALRRALHGPGEFEATLAGYLELRSNQLIDYRSIFLVYDVALFRLTLCHGFLQMCGQAGCSLELYRTAFRLLQPDCLRHSRLSHLAFKGLQLWLQRVSRPQVGLWAAGDSRDLEAGLEAVVFANWDNAVCRASVAGLFAGYLAAMKDRHEDFLSYLFERCVERLSWCHVSKYTILAEVCAAMDNVQPMTEPGFVSSLFNSLTLSHLCNASTKLYSVICAKLASSVWRTVFAEHLRNYVATWEAEKKYSSLQVLCKCWIEPVIKAHHELLAFLLADCEAESSLYQSHLLRIASKYSIATPAAEQQAERLRALLDHEEESVRLNAFAAHCYAGQPSAVKHFLYFNATARTSYLREGTLDCFRAFLVNLLRGASARKDTAAALDFLAWLHKFQLDCFEIGSCYQRKIFGLQLYKISLQFLQSNDCTDPIVLKDPRFKEVLKYGPRLRREMMESGSWTFTNKESIVLLFKLVLDPASDVRESAASVILDFFEGDVVTESEKIILFVTALNKCNSHKFFETESGAYLFKILTKWFPLNKINTDNLKFKGSCEPHSPIKDYQTYTRFLLKEAAHQLTLAKKDILKAATQNTPFYGVVTALLLVGFNDGPESHLMNSEFLEEVINLAEGAAKFFLNTFSAKSSNLEYSSSFKEMGLAIGEAIKNSEINYDLDELVLSPAEQTIITCVWRSLKILCELAVAVARNEHATDSSIRRASDLIVTVSTKCRHKGAIESAGVAIAHLTRYLCRRQKNVELMENHLRRLLSNDFSTSINLTRRGAGLTILFHKIVASDVRPERPFLHLAVSSLLQSLRQLSTRRPEARQDSDDPCAMQLHFLKSLVADKQLQAQLNPYLERICLVCFEYIPSEEFTVRNASYQLFGAIATRLVGQNTGAQSSDFGYGHSVNYFATHFPQLAGQLLLSLQACWQPGLDWRAAAGVVHVLALLSKMFYAGCELVDGGAAVYVRQLRGQLRLFLGSPVAHVRHLAAKSYAASVGLADLEAEVHRLEAETAAAAGSASGAELNRLNGYLCALERLHERLADERRSTRVRHTKVKSPSEVRRNLEMRAKTAALWELWCRRCAAGGRLCYALEAQLLRLSREFRLALREPGRPEAASSAAAAAGHLVGLLERTRPGFFDFVDELMQLLVRHVSYNEDLGLVRAVLGARCPDFGVAFLRRATNHGRGLLMASVDFAVENFERSDRLLLEEINAYANESIRSIIRSRLAELQYIDISKLKSFAARLEQATSPRTAQLSELLTFVHVLSLRGSGSYDLFEDLISCVSKERITLANYFAYPEAIRQLVAKALEILLYNFDHLSADKCRLPPYLAALILLKDEVECVREAIRDSLMDSVILELKLSKDRIMDELVCYVLMLNAVSEDSVLGELSYQETVDFFGKYLSTIEIRADTGDIENPFDDDNITPYKEDSKLVNFIVLCLRQKVDKGIHVNSQGRLDDISDSVFDTTRELVKNMNVDFDNLEDVLNVKYDAYLANKLQIVNEIYFKRK